MQHSSDPIPDPAYSEAGDWLADGSPVALLEDNLGDRGGRVFHGLVRTICAWTLDTVHTALAEIDAETAAGRWVVLSATHELGYALEPVLNRCLMQTGRPLFEAWVWADSIRLAPEQISPLLERAIACLTPAARVAGVIDLQPALADRRHADDVISIKQLIAAGECYQVNYTFPLRGRIYGDPLALYARLRCAQAVSYGVFVRHASGATLSRSPELFIERKGDRLVARPMKGTAALGQAEALRRSEKDRAENLMIVDLLRNDLGRLVPAGGVRVEALFQIEDYETLHQMTSTVVAEPAAGTVSQILRALFPCGSVTGAPKIRAMEIIRALEKEPRGVYCGALGAIGPDGDFSFNVPIRTLEIAADETVQMGIGSGIVADSDPAQEYAECLTKARFLTAMAPGFALFETLLLEADGGGFPLLERHIARLSRSAAAWGFPLDAEKARAGLQNLENTLQPTRRFRVRLSLDFDGSLNIQHAVLDPLPPHPTITIARRRLDPGNRLLGYKTTARAHYDRELADAVADGHFDTLFLNQRGELCEGARTNLFLLIDGTLWTPPLHCGLLPGVMRESLIEAAKATERVLVLSDLARADGVFVGNALRGLMPVSLVV